MDFSVLLKGDTLSAVVSLDYKKMTKFNAYSAVRQYESRSTIRE